MLESLRATRPHARLAGRAASQPRDGPHLHNFINGQIANNKFNWMGFLRLSHKVVHTIPRLNVLYAHFTF